MSDKGMTCAWRIGQTDECPFNQDTKTLFSVSPAMCTQRLGNGDALCYRVL